MMARHYLSTLNMVFLGLVLCDRWPIPAIGMETSGRMDLSEYNSTVTVTRGGSILLPCPFPRGWITRNYGVQWFRTPGPNGAQEEISASILPPRFSYAEDRASLQIAPVVVEDAGKYRCIVTTLGQSPYQGNVTKLRVLAPPTAPLLFLQVPPDLWSGQWNVLCMTSGFHPNQVRISWTQNNTESKLQDCTPESADHVPVQSNGPIQRKLTPEKDPDSILNGWLSASQAMKAKPRPHQQCICVTDSSGHGPYLISVLPLLLGPAAGVTYTCTVLDHPTLPAALSASLNWDPPSAEVIRCLNITKIAILSGAILTFTIAALNRLFKKR